jgi:methionine-rich copper-binding protein CopC
MQHRSVRSRPALGPALAALALVAAAGTALAHAYLDASTPAAFESAAVVDVVEMRFTADIEPAFSRFQVLRLDLPDDAWPADPVAPTDTEQTRLNALAARAIADEADDAVVAIEVAPGGRTPAVTLTPAAPLEPGAYAVAFEVLAVDGHTTNGHFVFFVRAD